MTPETLPISIVMLAHTNDERLVSTLNSVSWAREVCVSWNGPEPLTSLQQKWPKVQWSSIPGSITDFSAARMSAAKCATQPWVFFLDSDEVVRPFNTQQAQNFLESLQIAGGSVRRIDWFHGHQLRFGEVSSVHIIRIVRTGQEQFVRPVHEQLVIQGETVASPFTLDHFAHPSIQEFIESVRQYAEIEANFRTGTVSILECILWPSGKFLLNYILRGGFLDGWSGLVYAVMMSLHSFTVRIRLYEKHNTKK